MTKTCRKAQIEQVILKLLNEKPQININDIAKSIDYSQKKPSERRSIQRALKDLLLKKVITSQGNARAISYSLLNVSAEEISQSSPYKGNTFRDIPISSESKKLLSYFKKPLHARTPVGFLKTFLTSYKPNKISYLTVEQKKELISIGKVDNSKKPLGTYARHIYNRILIDLSWNSSRLEGNTYSLLETKRLIELGENATGKNAEEAQMILNHKGAIEYIMDVITDKEITLHTVCSVHALLSENLLGDPSASGRLREIQVGVQGSTYHPLDNPHVLKECFGLYLNSQNKINDPFEQSLFSLIHLSYLQAFEDVNKRTSRIIANIPLLKNNFKPLSFVDVPKEAYNQALIAIYEKNDINIFLDLFIWAYKRSAQKYTAIEQSMGEPNLLKLKYRDLIHEFIRELIINKIKGNKIVSRIKEYISLRGVPDLEANSLFNLIEIEILSLHEGNIARYKIRPSEFSLWKKIG